VKLNLFQADGTTVASGQRRRGRVVAVTDLGLYLVKQKSTNEETMMRKVIL